MKRTTRMAIGFVLKLFLFSCGLPLLMTSPAGAQQGCAEGEIRVNIGKFNDSKESVRNAAFEAVVKCDSKAIKVLNIIIKDQAHHPYIRSRATYALGKVGLGSTEAIKALIAVIQKYKYNDPVVLSNAIYALGEIGAGSTEAINSLTTFAKDKTIEPATRGNAISVIEKIGSGSANATKNLITILEDKKQVNDIRSRAAYALGQIGLGSEEALDALNKIIKDNDTDLSIRNSAISALSKIGLGTQKTTNYLVKIIDDQDIDYSIRYNAAIAVGNSESEEFWVQEKSQRVVITLKSAIKDKKSDSWIISDAADSLVEIGAKLEKNKKALPSDRLKDYVIVFQDTSKYLENEYPYISWKTQQDIKSTAELLQQQELRLEIPYKFWLNLVMYGLPIHIMFWILLIFIYPKFRQIQAFFFWNPKVRKIIGLWYVDFLLTWIPYLRSKLFAPFQESLLSDAYLGTFNPQTYFSDSDVKLQATTKTQSLQEAIPEIRGQIILEGESGLGKSMFLRHLVQKAQRIAVYLPAKKCDAGVLRAIQAKLHGYVKEDSNFLKNLIYSGAIDICIDGLNEVTPDTRAKITGFVESYFKGNIIMATQPLEWTPPSTAKTYTLQPLKDEQIEQFLISRTPILPEDAKVKGSDYEQACKNYLATVLNSAVPEEQIATRRMLSNPMELTIVALMLSQEEIPNLLNLQQQQFDIMEADYKRLYPAKTFPLRTFAETVYQMRLNDKAEIPPEEWQEELQCMERHKMVVSRLVTSLEGKSKTEWYFRHEKIQDFFIVQTFLGETEDNRLRENIKDPRFRGVYFLLARLMPDREGEALRETLIQYAADTKDHTVSDKFIQIFRSRKSFWLRNFS